MKVEISNETKKALDRCSPVHSVHAEASGDRWLIEVTAEVVRELNESRGPGESLDHAIRRACNIEDTVII